MEFEHKTVKESFEKLSKLKLSRAESKAIKSALVDHMKKTPTAEEFPHEEGAPVIISHSKNGWQAFATRNTVRVLILVFTLTVGTVFAAEKALPGDPFYAIKTEINEPLRGALTFSNKSKARWEYALAERRLGEVIELSESLRLTQEQHYKLVQEFKRHAEATRELDSQTFARTSVNGEGVATLSVFGNDSARVVSQGDESTQADFRDWLSLQKNKILEQTEPTTPEKEVILMAIEEELAQLESKEIQQEVSEAATTTSYFSDEQWDALDALGVDVDRFFAYTEQKDHCFVEGLGETRIVEITKGENPTLLDVLNIQGCVLAAEDTQEFVEESSDTEKEESQE